MQKAWASEQHRMAWLLILICLILIARISFQHWVRQQGFEALTADDFGRVVSAARWANNPTPILSGPWLPLYTYLIGLLLKLHWNILVIPRLVGVLTGLGSLLLMGMLAWQLSHSRPVVLLSIILLAINPVHIWLSLTPLTELLQIVMLLGFLTGITHYEASQQPRSAVLAIGCLAVGTMIRFEAWLFVGVFLILMLLRSRSAWLGAPHTDKIWRKWWWLVALVLCSFPVGWIVSNAIDTGDPFYFLTINRAFDQRWYGNQRTYLAYLQTWFGADPLSTLLALPAIAYGIMRSLTRRYTVLVCSVFVSFAILQGGQIQPGGNYLRYLLPWLFYLYPLIAIMVVALLRRTKRITFVILSSVVVSLLMVVQLPAALRFTNDPAVQGLAIGKQLATLRQHQHDTDGIALIELTYWQYLAIHVGANDVQAILYDRPLNYRLQNGSATMLDAQVLPACLNQYSIRYLIVQDPQLRTLVEETLASAPVAERDGYALYHVTAAFIPSSVPCPLYLNAGQ